MRWTLLLVLLLGCSGKKNPPAPLAALPDAALDAGSEVTTRADCEAAVSNMQKVSPALVPGDAADLDECLKLPRALVLCLQTVKTADEADACVDRAAGPEVARKEADAAPRASEAACRAMVAHYRELLPPADRDETTEASMLAACTRQLTPEDTECVLSARTRADAEACLGGG